MKYAKKYVDSIFFPITLGIISLIGWVLNFNIPSAIISAILCFLPLFGKDGRGYLSLVLLVPAMVYNPISFNNIDLGLFIFACTIVISLTLFIIIRRPKFRFGRIAISLIPLYAIFVISLIIQFSFGTPIYKESLYFLLGLFFILLFYLIFVPILYGDNVFEYFSKSLIILATLISLQVFIFYGRIGYENVGTTINIGWIQSSTMASSILVITLPFISFFFSKKKWWYLPILAILISAIYQLRTVSGILCTICIIIPLIFFTFKKYKYCPYYIIFSIFVFGIALSILFFVNDTFVDVMISSLRYLSTFLKGEIPAHQLGIELFLKQPVFGPSINALSNILGVDKGYIRLLDNTVVTTLVMGGSFGLAFYFFHLVNIFTLAFKKKNPYQLFFLIFLLAVELIGLVDNTIYNLFFNFIYLFIMAAYESSTRIPDVFIEQKFFSCYLNRGNY